MKKNYKQKNHEFEGEKTILFEKIWLLGWLLFKNIERFTAFYDLYKYCDPFFFYFQIRAFC